MVSMGEAVKDISPVLLIIAGAGALKEVLTESGTAARADPSDAGLHLLYSGCLDASQHLYVSVWDHRQLPDSPLQV